VRRKRTFEAGGLALLAAAAVAAVQYGFVAGGSVWAANTAWLSSSAFAAACVALARASADAASRRGWTLLLAGCTAYLAGSLLWASYTAVGAPRSPNPADLLWYAFALLAGAGLYLLIPRGERSVRREALELLPLGVASAALAVALFMGDARSSALSPLDQAAALAYPVVYVLGALLILQAALAAGVRPIREASVGVIFLGVALQAGGFILWCPQLLAQTYVAGHSAIDALWTLGMLVLGGGALLAAAGRGRPAPAREDEAQQRTVILPAVTYVLLTVELMWSAVSDDPLAQRIVLQLGLLTTGLLLIARAVMTSRAQVALLREQRTAREAADRYFELSPQMLATVDAEGVFARVNPEFERVLGWSADELRSRPFAAFLHADDVEASLSRVAGRESGSRGNAFENRYRHRRGGYRRLRWRSHLGSDGVLYAAAQDVTEAHAAHEAIERSNRELEQFASIAAHDLQEPLRKVRAFADRLAKSTAGRLDASEADDLERVQSAAARMQRLIGDLLALSRVQTAPVRLAAVDLEEVAAGVAADLEGRLEGTGGRIEVEPLPVIRADRVQMGQLLQNLVSNGLKFAREGVSPVVRVSATLEDGACALVVSDNGIGFEEQYLDRIFLPFERLHARGAYEGTGIGLALCQKIAERHGGSVTATSSPGEGSTFVVTLDTAPTGEESP
jgi:PAS domain S-box-containing protein